MDVIHRLKAVILELERMKDHVLLVTHRAVVRVLLAYFKGLSSKNLLTMEVSSNTLYAIEPVSHYNEWLHEPVLIVTLQHPYGVSVTTFKYNAKSQWFREVED